VDRLPENKKSYGQCLTVYFITKSDQVHLKLLAAMDQTNKASQFRHYQDLVNLSPTEVELQSATTWLLKRECGSNFKKTLKLILDQIGHGEIVAQI
jgi:hypothetical protein